MTCSILIAYSSRTGTVEALALANAEFAAEAEDRRVNVFDGGFVQQHRLHVTQASGHQGYMDVCFVAYVRDGIDLPHLRVVRHRPGREIPRPPRTPAGRPGLIRRPHSRQARLNSRRGGKP
jgi:hypothetical protein